MIEPYYIEYIKSFFTFFVVRSTINWLPKTDTLSDLDESWLDCSKTGAHLGCSEGRDPNFRKGANQYKAEKKRI